MFYNGIKSYIILLYVQVLSLDLSLSLSLSESMTQVQKSKSVDWVLNCFKQVYHNLQMYQLYYRLQE